MLQRRETLLFLIAFAVRIAVFLFLSLWAMTGHMPELAPDFPILSGDSADFYNLSQNVYNYHTFSSSTSFPLIPESFRVPGYPWLIALLSFLPLSLFLVVLVQIVCAGGTVILTYLFGKKYISERVGFWGALLLCFEPTSVFFSVTIMSDTIFVFTLMLSAYLFLYRSPDFKKDLLLKFLAGLLFGYSILIRVIAEFLGVFLILVYAIMHRQQLRPLLKTSAVIGTFVISAVIVVSPWALRNHYVYNTYTLSSTPYINFIQYNLAQFYAYQHNKSFSEVGEMLAADIPYPRSSLWFRQLTNEQIFLKQRSELLRGNLFPYLQFHAVKTLPYFLNDSLRDINRIVGLFPMPAKPTNFTDLLLARNFESIKKYFLTPNPDLWMLLVGATVWITITLLGLWSVAVAVARRLPSAWFVLFSAGVIGYFALLSSVVIQPRYRMPAAPFMLLLAVYGAIMIYDFIKSRRAVSRRNDI